MTAIVSSQSAHRNRGHSHPDHLTKCHNSFLTLEHCLILFDFFFSILWLFFIVVNGIERIILPHVVWFDLFRFFYFLLIFFVFNDIYRRIILLAYLIRYLKLFITVFIVFNDIERRILPYLIWLISIIIKIQVWYSYRR